MSCQKDGVLLQNQLLYAVPGIREYARTREAKPTRPEPSSRPSDMSWLALLRLALQIAGAIADIVRAKHLMDAGAARETALMLKGILDRAGIAREIEAETARLTPEQILRELEQAGELRD